MLSAVFYEDELIWDRVQRVCHSKQRGFYANNKIPAVLSYCNLSSCQDIITECYVPNRRTAP